MSFSPFTNFPALAALARCRPFHNRFQKDPLWRRSVYRLGEEASQSTCLGRSRPHSNKFISYALLFLAFNNSRDQIIIQGRSRPVQWVGLLEQFCYSRFKPKFLGEWYSG